MKTLLLIDANSIIHRSFHALPPLTTPDGRPIQAIYGLASILLKLWREEKPDYAAALFDRPEPTFRERKYAEYKAQRPAVPDELVSQIIGAHDLFLKFGLKTFEKPGFEADDLIATLAEKFSAAGDGGENGKDLKIVILTGDLDTLQLVKDGKIAVRTFKRGVSDTMTYDEKAVYERYGLRPDQLVDYKALVGDPSDNIKGVPGIGPKTASGLLKRFGTLDKIYANLGRDAKLEKRLAPFKKEAELSRELVVLNRKVPLSIGSREELKVESDEAELGAYFKRLGFETLLKRLGGGKEPEKIPEIGGTKKQGLIFEPEKSSPPGAAKSAGAILINYPDSREGYSEDFSSDKPKVGFALKDFLKKLWREGKDLRPPYFDLGVAFWLLDPDLKDYGPAGIFRKFFKREWRGGGDISAAYEFSKRKMEEYGILKVFEEMEMPLIRILAEMEVRGIKVSRAKLLALEKKIKEKLAGVTEEIYAVAGEKFNINSPRQVGHILFDKFNIAPSRPKTKSGLPSTRAANLEELRGRYRIADLILDYRESFKILSTYAAPLLKLVKGDGRLHTEFVQTGTATGRLSSKAPNLQNIPQESIWAEELRSAFEAPDLCSLVSFDYSQLQLRILAALSGDEKMTSSFKSGMDIHRVTASKVLGVPLDKVSESDRRLAKTLNFGLVYGMGASAFARTSGLPKSRAEDFIASYFREFKKVKEWQEEIKKKARTFGYTQTLTGRRRYLFGINAGARFASEAERAAINHPVQGLEADFLKMSMIRINAALADLRLKNKGVNMILSIHDELLFEVPDDIIEKTSFVVKKIMEEIYPLSVPLAIDVSSGKDWGHLHKLKTKN